MKASVVNSAKYSAISAVLKNGPYELIKHPKFKMVGDTLFVNAEVRQKPNLEFIKIKVCVNRNDI